MDELRAARMDLSIESTITMALREENKKNEEEIREQYNNKVRQMEQMFKSYHERSEVSFIWNFGKLIAFVNSRLYLSFFPFVHFSYLLKYLP